MLLCITEVEFFKGILISIFCSACFDTNSILSSPYVGHLFKRREELQRLNTHQSIFAEGLFDHEQLW